MGNAIDQQLSQYHQQMNGNEWGTETIVGTATSFNTGNQQQTQYNQSQLQQQMQQQNNYGVVSVSNAGYNYGNDISVIGNNNMMMKIPSDEGECEVFQITFGMHGSLGLDLAFATVHYLYNSQSTLAHVPIVLQGPPGLPLKRGDILISMNGIPLIAGTAGNQKNYLNTVKQMIASQAPPRVIKFFRSTRIIAMHVFSGMNIDLPPRDASIFLNP